MHHLLKFILSIAPLMSVRWVLQVQRNKMVLERK